MAKRIQVGGRIESKEVGGIVTGAAEILDDAKGKKQSVINGETDDELLRLDQSKQDNLTFDNAPTEGSDNPVKSGGVYAAQQAILLAIAAINELIPSAASALNQLADKAFVNSSISTNTATFRGTSAAGLNEQQFLAWANGLEHDLNDYVFWQTSDAAGNTLFKRYKWNGTEWAYEYTLNNSTFTAEQWKAIQSGITALLVAKLRALPTAEQLIQSFDGKQDVLTFDNVPTLGSTNPVKSSGIFNAIKEVSDALNTFISETEALIPAEATAQNQLADKADVAAKIVASISSWKGQYDALTDLQAVTGAKAGDMGCVKTTDSDGHAVLTFYQYSAQGAWVVYYTLRHYAQNKPATTGTTGDYPYNGMGRIELQKNIVNGVNTLTQAMLTQDNTIYVIQYDFVLASDVTIPANCILEFDGGSLSGAYTITGSNTGIQAGLVKIFNTDVTLAGSWNVTEAYPEWFGANGDGVVDDTNSVQKAVNYFQNIKVNNTYKCTSVIFITHDYTKVEGSGTFIFTTSLGVRAYNCDNITFKGFKVVTLSGYSGVGVWTGNETFVTNINPNTKVHYENIIVDGVDVDNYSSGYRELNHGNHCVDIREWGGSSIKNITVQNCRLRGSGVDPNALQSLDGSDNIYCGSYDNQAAPMENIKILNNICEYAGRNNLSLASSNTSCIKNAVVSGNLFKDSTMCGFDIEHASEIHCCNNKFIGCGKFTGYYDPADSAYHNNYALQSAICNTEAPDHFVSCTFDDCRVLGADRATLDNCVIKNTPITKQSLTYYSVNLYNCYVDMSGLTGVSIGIYNDTVFDGCKIILGDSYASFIYDTTINNCTITYTGNSTAINFENVNTYRITNSKITALNGRVVGTKSQNAPQIIIDNCTIEAYQLLGSLVYINSISVVNCNITVDVISQTWYNLNQDFYYKLSNNTISCKLPIGMPWTKLVELNNNVFNITGTYTPAESGWGDSRHFIFSKTIMDNCKVSVKDNIIKGLPTTTTNLVTERNQGDSKNAILDITGNVISGSGSQQIQVFEGKKSSTAASIIERNSYNGTDLAS